MMRTRHAQHSQVMEADRVPRTGRCGSLHDASALISDVDRQWLWPARIAARGSKLRARIPPALPVIPAMKLETFLLGRRLANRESNEREIGALEAVPAMGLDAL